jgi:hypothetical protein
MEDHFSATHESNQPVWETNVTTRVFHPTVIRNEGKIVIDNYESDKICDSQSKWMLLYHDTLQNASDIYSKTYDG